MSLRTFLVVPLPGLVAGVFVFFQFTDEPVSSRLMTAAVSSFVTWASFAIGMTVSIGVVGLLRGDDAGKGSQDAPWESRSFVAGMFLATAVWIWWQHSRSTEAVAIERCVERRALDREGLGPARLVRICFDEIHQNSSDDRQ